MMLDSHFSVAALVGHSALDHLALAMDVYDEARQATLLDVASTSWPECLAVGAQLGMLRRAELDHCIQAVILFQTMMEKIPSFVPGIGSGITPTKKTGFAPAWRDLISRIGGEDTREEAGAAFESYRSDFYRAFRNPIVHGKNKGDIEKVNRIRVPGVHQGMLQGWRAYDHLLTEAFAPEQIHQPSWAVMSGIHDIAVSLDLSRYPDLDDLQGQFFRKHSDGARAAMDS